MAHKTMQCTKQSCLAEVPVCVCLCVCVLAHLHADILLHEQLLEGEAQHHGRSVCVRVCVLAHLHAAVLLHEQLLENEAQQHGQEWAQPRYAALAPAGLQ